MSIAFELGQKLGNALIGAFHKTHVTSQTIFEKSGASIHYKIKKIGHILNLQKLLQK